MIQQEITTPNRRLGHQPTHALRTQLVHLLASVEARTTALVAASATFDLVGLLTLILLFLFAGHAWFIDGPITLLAAAAILHRPWLRSHNFWFVTAAVLVAGNYYNWFAIDNHQYLITYWTIAFCCALTLPRPQVALAFNAKLLIGLLFLFATCWKLITPDYLNASFFTFELLTDDRFRNVAETLTAAAPHFFRQNAEALQALLMPTSQLTAVSLTGVTHVRPLAQLLTWWTITIEGALALLFLLPTTRWSFRLRSSVLLIFLVTTYTNAPVIGFGWLLAVMGIAQCKPQSWQFRLLFLAAFFLIWLYGMPWSDLSFGLFSVRLPLAR